MNRSVFFIVNLATISALSFYDYV